MLVSACLYFIFLQFGQLLSIFNLSFLVPWPKNWSCLPVVIRLLCINVLLVLHLWCDQFIILWHPCVKPLLDCFKCLFWCSCYFPVLVAVCKDQVYIPIQHSLLSTDIFQFVNSFMLLKAFLAKPVIPNFSLICCHVIKLPSYLNIIAHF